LIFRVIGKERIFPQFNELLAKSIQGRYKDGVIDPLANILWKEGGGTHEEQNEGQESSTLSGPKYHSTHPIEAPKKEVSARALEQPSHQVADKVDNKENGNKAYGLKDEGRDFPVALNEMGRLSIVTDGNEDTSKYAKEGEDFKK
jgi:hypothetical protein